MIKELKFFFTALMFYSRIPAPKWVGYSDEQLNKSTKYFPLIGLIVGSFSALIFWSSSFIFPIEIAIIFSIIASVLLTGAFHEDGFADACDGFGGGYSKSQILSIMKDSRIGTYGTIGLILLFISKFFLLKYLPLQQIPFILIASHGLSRFAPILIIYFFQYSREDEKSKVKPIGKSINIIELLFAFIFSVASLFLLHWFFFFIIPLIFIIAIISGFYFKNKIGGYTGDCLGATQQISEIVFYISSYIICIFIV